MTTCPTARLVVAAGCALYAFLERCEHDHRGQDVKRESLLRTSERDVPVLSAMIYVMQMRRRSKAWGGINRLAAFFELVPSSHASDAVGGTRAPSGFLRIVKLFLTTVPCREMVCLLFVFGFMAFALRR